MSDRFNLGLIRLLLVSGIPTTREKFYELQIHAFVDQDSFIFYAYKFKRRSNKSFKLWLTPEQIANANMNHVLNFLSTSRFSFTGELRDSLTEKVPNFFIDETEVNQLQQFLASYQPLCSI